MTMLASAMFAAAPAAAGTAAAAGSFGSIIATEAAGAAAFTGASAGFDILGFLSNGLTIASMASDIMGGFQQSRFMREQGAAEANALRWQAEDMKMEADQESINSMRRANDAREEMQRITSSQRLAWAANGMDVTFGTPVDVQRDEKKSADMQLSADRNDAMLRQLARRRQAREMIIESDAVRARGNYGASSAARGGVMSAISTGGNFLMRRSERG